MASKYRTLKYGKRRNETSGLRPQMKTLEEQILLGKSIVTLCSLNSTQFYPNVFTIFPLVLGSLSTAYDDVSPASLAEMPIMCIIIHMQKFQHAHWLRTRQLIPNSAES